MQKTRRKAIFALLLSTVAVMAVTVKDTPPVAEYLRTGVRLSDLSAWECTAFVASKGAEKAWDFPPAMTKEFIICYENDPQHILTGTFGSLSTNRYAEEVRKIVNDYYGVRHVEYYFDHYPEYPPFSAVN